MFNVDDDTSHSVVRIGSMPPDFMELSEYGLTEPVNHLATTEEMAWDNLIYVLNNNSYSRFSKGNIGIAYASKELLTAVTEKAYWLQKLIFEKPGGVTKVPAIEMSFDIRGSCIDATNNTQYKPEFTHPYDYSESQKLGDWCDIEEIDFLKAPSARRNTGVNFPIFREESLQSNMFARVVEFNYVNGETYFTNGSVNFEVNIENVFPNWTP